DPILSDFLAKVGGRAECVALGIAGAVVDGRSHGTNLPWAVEERALEAEFGIPCVQLLNDFAAASLGVLKLSPGEVVTLQAGVPEADGAIGILGAGTGLGEGILTRQMGRYFVVHTEAGHADFAARTDAEIELLKFLRA